MYKLQSNNYVVVSKRFGSSIRTILSPGNSPQQIIISELNESHVIFCYDITFKIGKEQPQASLGYRYYKELKSFRVTAITADDGDLEIRGMALDKSTQRLIIVLYSKDRMLQIF